MRAKNDVSRQQETTGKRRAMAGLTERLAVLETMTVAQLREEYQKAFGEPSRSHNKGHLRKKVAWRIQEQAEGGLSPRALDRIEQLAPTAPARWQTPRNVSAMAAGPAQTASGNDSGERGRDPRLPATGTVITRTHQGVDHLVTVLDDGFEYQGQRFISLSRIARVITGTPWNGYLFWGLEHRPSRKAGEGR